ncbi:MAG: DEAD/DEAH box helicase, partial [Spirochaetes bacterium]|nr:DEAD/DEAH box helicase [Spirochaetota bacterium]
QLMIGVPGRILKLVENGSLKLTSVKKIVLDEADFLIDLGFLKDLEIIFSHLKNINQIMVYSATLSKKTKRLLDMMNHQNLAVRIDSANKLPENIENLFFPINDDKERDSTLLKIMNHINPYLAIIFTRTKKESIYLFQFLKNHKIPVLTLHGDLAPAQRKRNIKEFQAANVPYLVATDLAGRGLDIEGITHIINYSLPMNELDYLHRAGRTGRMGQGGLVYSICNELDEGYLKNYAWKLDFTLSAAKIKNEKIQVDPHYRGVKTRLNIKEKKLANKLFNKPKQEKKNARKAFRNKKRR